MGTLRPKDALARYAELAVALQAQVRSDAGPIREHLLRRSAQRLYEVFESMPSIVLAIVHLQGGRGSGTFGPASVSVHAMAMGQRLGLERRAVIDIAMAALLHDLGTLQLPDVSQPGKGDQELVKALRRAPLLTTLAVGRGVVTPEVLRRIAVSWDVHDSSEPGAQRPPLSGLASLVTVASAYERLCSPVAPGLGLVSSQAMRVLLFAAGRRFDERMTRLLATTVGLYAPGTTVELSGGEEAIVIERPRDPARIDRPVVMLGTQTVDLSENTDRAIVKETSVNDGTLLARHFVVP